MKINLAIFVFAIVIVSCHSGKVGSSVSNPRKTPSWVIHRPVVNGYYTGVGVANIDAVHENHIEVAKNNALNDLVSEISVTISSNSIIRQFENNAGFKEEFESLSNASIRDNIEGYELVGSWADDQHYWVYYRLSKDKYREIKERKLQRAKALGYDLYKKGKESQSVRDISNALSYYFKALDALKTHLDEDLSLMSDDSEQFFLVNEILAAMLELFNGIEVQADQTVITTKVALPMDRIISFAAMYNAPDGSHIPLRNMPFRNYFQRGAGDLTSKVVTDQEGKASFSLGRVTGNASFQEVSIEIDVMSMIENEKGQAELLKDIISLNSAIPSGKIHLNVSPLIAYYQVNELEFGKPSPRRALSNEIKKYLSQNFFSFTSDTAQADVKVLLDSRAVNGNFNQQHNLYTVFIDCYLSIIDVKTSTKVYYKGFDQVRGQQVGALENGLKDAQINLLKRVREEIIPEIHRLDF